MKDKTPVEQLRDKVAEILTELLELAEPFLFIGVLWLSFKVLEAI